jgi:hypothetical protein
VGSNPTPSANFLYKLLISQYYFDRIFGTPHFAPHLIGVVFSVKSIGKTGTSHGSDGSA